MKKILLGLLIMFFTQGISFAYDVSAQALVVGENMLSKNGLPSATIVVTSDSAAVNSNINETNVLYVQTSNLNYAGNDNEVAAVISQELGAIINASASKKEIVSSLTSAIVGQITDEKTKETASTLNELSLSHMSKKDLMDADITGVDLMIKAGYNPLAMIVTLGKMDASLWELLKGEPANFKRTMNIYDYLSYNYPSKVKAGYNCQEYKAFLDYIAPTIKKRENNAKALKKFQTTQAKAKEKRAKQIAKYKLSGGVNGWDVSKIILNNLSTQSEIEQ
ncbi:MAG: hypothetical protein E7Z91_06800 [Cyanobacteria bacterium SIG30]|nr:hypothetical protein [Cyanobacteria bacterium SIG30]